MLQKFRIHDVHLLLTLLFMTMIFCGPSVHSICVTKDGAKLRREPRGDAPMSWQVPKFMPLKFSGKTSGKFLEVQDLENERHWVAREDISTKMICLVVKASITTLRTGPGDHYPRAPAGYADRYSAFQDLGGEDGWTNVVNDQGEKSWINLDTTWKPARTMKINFDN